MATTRGSGIGLQANYGFSSRRVSVLSQVEHYDREFVMDTAFMNRVGFTSGWGYSDYNFYPDKDRYPWVRKISPFIFVQGGRDRIQGGDDHVIVGGVRVSMTRQGFFRADRVIAQEAWRGAEYDGGSWRANAQMQLFPWLRPSVSVACGRVALLRRDRSVPRQLAGGRARRRCSRLAAGSARTSSSRTTRSIGSPRASASTPSTCSTRAPPTSSRRSWRSGAIVRFDSQRRRVLTDLLGSYDLRPGTVVLCRVRLALSEAGVPRRAVGRRRRGLPDDQPGAVLEGELPVPFLTGTLRPHKSFYRRARRLGVFFF